MKNSHSFTRLTPFLSAALPPGLLLGFLLAVAAPAQAQEAGALERISGNVSVVNAANQTRIAKKGDVISAGDTVSTDKGGEALLKMKDDSVLILRGNTQMKLTEYHYDQKPTDSMFASLLKGAVRSVSGLLGKAHPSNVRFATATATVGIRGTDFELAIVETDSGDTRAGTYDYVYDGKTNIAVAAGNNVDVAPEQTGLALANPKPGEEPVQLLREKPAFLSGGGFDAILLQLTQPMPMMPMMR